MTLLYIGSATGSIDVAGAGWKRHGKVRDSDGDWRVTMCHQSTVLSSVNHSCLCWASE